MSLLRNDIQKSLLYEILDTVWQMIDLAVPSANSQYLVHADDISEMKKLKEAYQDNGFNVDELTGKENQPNGNSQAKREVV